MTETFGEGVANLLVDLGLVDPVHEIFYRVLQGDDIYVFRVHPFEHGGQSGRFAGAGRTGDEDGAERFGHSPFHHLQGLSDVAQVGQVNVAAQGVQDTHHPLLAVLGRKSGDAEVNLAVVELGGETSVLGQPRLVYLQVG